MLTMLLQQKSGAPEGTRTPGLLLRRQLLYPTELLAQIKSVERVTGIEPASPAWKAGALAIVLHLHSPSAKIVSSVIIASEPHFVNAFSEFFCTFLRYPSRAVKSPAPSAAPGCANAPQSRSGCHCTAKTGSVLCPTASTVPSSAQARTQSPFPSRRTA